MLMLVVSVAIASLLGSMHCVGMCGPLTAVCIQPAAGRRTQEAIFAYHLGRLVSYALLGAIAGCLGATFQATTNLLGLQRSVASIAGVVLATIGLMGLMRMTLGQTISFHPPQWVVRWISPAVRWLRSDTNWRRGLALGLLTAALPCGWLYVFLLTAAASASISSGALIMAVFSLGSVPLLTLAMLGGAWFGNRYSNCWPVISSILLIVVGMVTALHRSTVDLTVLQSSATVVQGEIRDNRTLVQQVEHLATVELPCCQTSAAAVDRTLQEKDKLVFASSIASSGPITRAGADGLVAHAVTACDRCSKQVSMPCASSESLHAPQDCSCKKVQP